ncbi:MAG: hypothetical protein MJ123_12265 [Lachnospiraceae bacterium]|nr:hypothetical protein [Lachnospiraceae bacterium]
MEKDILSIFCPSCGAPAEFDIVNQIYRCRYCKGTVGIEEAKQEKVQYQQKIRKRVRTEVGNYPLMSTSCSGCGANLVIEENEAISTCDFCGRKLVRKKYTHADDVPEAIIPFVITKEEAKTKIEEWCAQNKNRREAKRLIKKTYDLKGYYLPYQMARGPVYCKVNKKKDTTVFSANGYIYDEFINCSKQLDNLVLDAMEPYDLSGLKEFEYAYVAGQRVKISDIPREVAKERLIEEVDSNYRVFLEKIWGTKAIDVTTTVKTVFEAPVLLPVYYIKDGEVSAAVNGQTGKVSVKAEKLGVSISLPWWLEAILTFIISCSLIFGIGWMASGKLMETVAVTCILAIFYLFIFCFMFEPGLDNKGSIIRYRNIFTSGEKTFRREKGTLVLNDTILKRKIAEPVFKKKLKEEEIPVTYIFRSKKRIFSMIMLAMAGVFLPVILALFVNGFNFAQIDLRGSAVWFCITLPTAPILLVQLGLKELYTNPWVYRINEDGSRIRYHETELTPWQMIKKGLGVVGILCLHPLGWMILACMGVMVYLTAFGW